MTTKLCTKCTQLKSLEDFHNNKNNKDGKAYYCKECMRTAVNKHHKNPEYKQRQEEQKGSRTKRNRDFLWSYLLEHPCEHCGEADPRVLEFDHIDQSEKLNDISYLVTRASLETLQEEITKCRVLCANCHRIRSAYQMNYWWTDTAYAGSS